MDKNVKRENFGLQRLHGLTVLSHDYYSYSLQIRFKILLVLTISQYEHKMLVLFE